MIFFYKGTSLVKAMPSHNRGINYLASNGPILVSAGKDKKLKFWNTKTMSHLQTVKI